MITRLYDSIIPHNCLRNAQGNVIELVAGGRIEYLSDGALCLYDNFNREVVSWESADFIAVPWKMVAARHACVLARAHGMDEVKFRSEFDRLRSKGWTKL